MEWEGCVFDSPLSQLMVISHAHGHARGTLQRYRHKKLNSSSRQKWNFPSLWSQAHTLNVSKSPLRGSVSNKITASRCHLPSEYRLLYK